MYGQSGLLRKLKRTKNKESERVRTLSGSEINLVWMWKQTMNFVSELEIYWE